MRVLKLIGAVSVLFATAGLEQGIAFAQQPQIPTLQVCNFTRVAAKADVFVQSRQDAGHTGHFVVKIDLTCDPSGSGYPTGSLEMKIDMSDSIIDGNVSATTFEQATTTGKHTPTTYLSGRCKSQRISQCRYWMMLADNKRANAKGTADIIGFLIFDPKGKRVAYGTGPVLEGDVNIAGTAN